MRDPIAVNGCLQGDECEESFNSWSTLKPVNLFGNCDDVDEAEAEVDSLQVGSSVNFEEDDSKIKALHRVRAFKLTHSCCACKPMNAQPNWWFCTDCTPFGGNQMRNNFLKTVK